MEENEAKHKNRGRSEREGKIDAEQRKYPARAPWWLVFFMIFLLVGFGAYIVWLNLSDGRKAEGIFAYAAGLVAPREVSDSLRSRADSLTIWQNSLLRDHAIGSDPALGDWAVDSVLEDDPPQKADARAELAETTPVPAETESSRYYIRAGEFKSRSSALARIRELRQGNYPAKLIDPDSAGGAYRVVVGEYGSYSTAKSKSDAIGFILDITTVVERKK